MSVKKCAIQALDQVLDGLMGATKSVCRTSRP